MSNSENSCDIGVVRYDHGEKFTPLANPGPITMDIDDARSLALYLKTEITEGDTTTFNGWLARPNPAYCFTPASQTNELGTLALFSDGRITFTLDNGNPSVNALQQGQSMSAILSVPLGRALGEEEGLVVQNLELTVNIKGIDDSSYNLPRTQEGSDDFFPRETSFYQTLLPQMEKVEPVL